MIVLLPYAKPKSTSGVVMCNCITSKNTSPYGKPTWTLLFSSKPKNVGMYISKCFKISGNIDNILIPLKEIVDVDSEFEPTEVKRFFES